MLSAIDEHLRSYEEALAYPPNRVYIGCLSPEKLWDIEKPWWKRHEPAARFGKYGEIMPEAELYALLNR